jgi:hypothetical protein
MYEGLCIGTPTCWEMMPVSKQKYVRAMSALEDLTEFGRLFLGMRFTLTANCCRVATNTSHVFIQDCVMCLQFPVLV